MARPVGGVTMGTPKRNLKPLAPRPSLPFLLDSFPDPHTLSDEQLAELIDVLTRDDQENEHLRGVTQRKVQILRAELIRRSGRTDDDLG
jgi:hypothetical protein